MYYYSEKLGKVQLEIGSVVQPDGWGFATQLVEAGDWDLENGANYRIDRSWWDTFIPTLPVHVAVTGRVARRRPTHSGLWCRVRITFVNDGEPNTADGGWLLVDRGYR